MNELLGILIFVGYADVARDLHLVRRETRELLTVLNSREHLEADVYWCFARVMDLGISELFNPVVSHQSRTKKKPDLFTWDAEKSHNDLVNQDKSQEQNVSSILRRCHKVHHQLLQSIDKELFNYIENKKTEPQMYLQRWIRCMLSREFNLADTLMLWDAIFAKYFLEPEKELALLDYLCVAMIVFVRAFCKK
jgi:TBC1 domain family protein 5